MLGEFEYLLLTAAKRLGEEAYGASIRQEIEGATDAAARSARFIRPSIGWRRKAFSKRGWVRPHRNGVAGPSEWSA